jgi:release factor glutamine methyltransferase
VRAVLTTLFLKQRLLAPGGRFYLVAVEENRPKDIMLAMSTDYGLKASIAMQRSAGRERLSVLKFEKDHRA